MQENIIFMIAATGEVVELSGSFTAAGGFVSPHRPDLHLRRECEGVTWFRKAADAFERALTAARANKEGHFRAMLAAAVLENSLREQAQGTREGGHGQPNRLQ